MRLLVDALLPDSIETEAPAGVVVTRWKDGEVKDTDFLRAGARAGVRAVVVLDRRSLYQPGLRELAVELGVGLVAVEADDPVEAKERLFSNIEGIRRTLLNSEAVLVLAHEARAE